MAQPDPWQGTPIDLHRIPIFILTSGAQPAIPGKSAAELTQFRQALYDLHEDILAASKSAIRRHEIVAGASHYIHYTNPEIVIGAARELISRSETIDNAPN
jgi:pimeloyl-ACP methyl ester carboxylesterase